jgi:hypothetical protein
MSRIPQPSGERGSLSVAGGATALQCALMAERQTWAPSYSFHTLSQNSIYALRSAFACPFHIGRHHEGFAA